LPCIEKVVFSDLLHVKNINRLDLILPSENLIEDIVSHDLIVFNDHTDLDFLNAVSDRNELVSLVPNETIGVDGGENFVGKSV
jgi:hypothetical protein